MPKIKPAVLLKAGAFGLFIVITAVIGITFVARRNVARPKDPGAGTKPTLGGAVTTVADNFRELHSENGKDLFLLTAAKDQGFEDGHHELQGVRLEFYGKNTDRNDVITSDHAYYDQA